MLQILFILITLYSEILTQALSFVGADKSELYSFDHDNIVFFSKHTFQFNVPPQQIHKITVLDQSNIETYAKGTNNLQECLIINFQLKYIMNLRKILKNNTNNVSTIIFVFKDIHHFIHIQHSITYLKLSSEKQVIFARSTSDLSKLSNTASITIKYDIDIKLPLRVNYNVYPLTELIHNDKVEKVGFYIKHYSQIALFFSLLNLTNFGDSDHFISQIITQYKSTAINEKGEKSILNNEHLFNEARNIDQQIQRLKTIDRVNRFKLDLSPVLFSKQDFFGKFGSEAENQFNQLYFLNCKELSSTKFDGNVCSTNVHIESTLAWKVIDECLNESSTLKSAKWFDLNVFKLKLYSYITDNYSIQQQTSIQTNLDNWTNDILKYFKYLNQSMSAFNAQSAYNEIKKCTDDANLDFINRINSKYKSIFSYINTFNVFSIETLNFTTHKDLWHTTRNVMEEEFDYHVGRGMVRMDLPRELCGIKMGEHQSEYCDYLNRLNDTSIVGTHGAVVWKKVLEVVLVLILLLFIVALIYLRYVNTKLLKTTYRYIQMKTNRESNVDLEEDHEMYK